MPGSVTSVFSEAKDFAAALRGEGWLGLLVTGAGEFRARLTQATLHHLRLTAAEERLPRIGVAAVPPDLILVSLARGSGPEPIWGGVRLGQREIIMLGAGQRLYMRTDGPCRGGSIGLPVSKLARYGSAMIGADFDVPRAAQWRRPRPAMIRHLRHLYSAGIDAIERRSNASIDRKTAHGLEQQLIEAVVECLSDGSAIEATGATGEHQDVVALRGSAGSSTEAAYPDRRNLVDTRRLCSNPCAYPAPNSSVWVPPSTCAAGGYSWCTVCKSL